MNRIKLKEEILGQVARDKFDMPIAPLSGLKYDVFDTISKYAVLSKNDVKMKVQVLGSGKYKISFDILIDEFIN